MNQTKVLKIVIFLIAEVISQGILLAITNYLALNMPTLNIIVGMLVALAFMGYWDSSQSIRLGKLERDVEINTLNSDLKITKLSVEIQDTKQELDTLKNRLDKIEKR